MLTRSTWFMRILRAFALLVAAGFALMFWVGDGWFYFPNQRVYAAPTDFGVDVEEVSFAAPGGPSLHGWWMKAPGEPKGTVVYCHGNAANVTLHAHYVEWLPKRGFSVLVFDYRGYGRSDGAPTRAGTVADAVAAIDLALARDPDHTVVFGHSLGGAIGVAAAAQRPAVRGVIAESTFSNYREIACSKAPLLAPLVPLFLTDGLDPDDALAALPPAPLLVVHGERDRIVPCAHGQRLFEQAHEPKELWLVPEVGHATPWRSRPEEFERRFESFFASAMASGRRRGA